MKKKVSSCERVMEEKTFSENTLIRKRVRIKKDKRSEIKLESLKRKKCKEEREIESEKAKQTKLE